MFVAACTASDPDTVLPCPGVEVLQDLGEMTRFAPGPGRDPIDVEMEAWIERVGGECILQDGSVAVDLSVKVGTRRGPANKTSAAKIRYFVAVTDRDRKILSRQAFQTTAPYSSRKTISIEDVLTLDIPLARGASTDSYTIYVGLELSPEELRYNRSKNARQ